MESLEELESLDVPRGVVAAANRYAGEKTDLSGTLLAIRKAELPLSEADIHRVIKMSQVEYRFHFDAFVAGAKWTLENWGFLRRPPDKD